MLRVILIIFILLFATGWPSNVINRIDDRETRVRDVIGGELEENEFPGIQYLVVDKDTTLFSYAGGIADIAANRAMRDNTTMMIYSMTKTITAAAVLLLVERGEIALEDPVTRYLPDIPYGKEVKIRHLLSQTSGIPNPIPLRWIHLAEEHAHFDQQAALREILEENPELDFTPGDRFAYSNISYWLLGYVIEKASGTGYEEYVRQNVFRKLAIPEAEIGFVIPSPEHHAKGYLPKWSLMNIFKSFVVDSRFAGDYEDNWLHVYDHYLNGPSFGGVIGTAHAIGIFLRDQLQDTSRLVSPETKALFFQQQKDNQGQPIPMTLGWHIGSVDGVQFFFKEGGGGGFRSEMRIYPSAGIASVVMVNNASFNPGAFLKNVDREFFNK